MKIGITTYFNIKNYGSVLQAFALRETLLKNGYDSEFFNIRENAFWDKLFHKAHVATVTAFKCLLSKEARKTQNEIFRLKKETTSVISVESSKKFDLFEKENLPSVGIGRRQLKKIASTEEYDAFICGSDQIWSPLSPHLSGYKFLDFAPLNKRIAYAPSFGVSKIPSYNKSFIKKKLSLVNNISVRENEGAKIVKELIHRDVPVVLDPTMLLTGETWRELYKEKSSIQINHKYALCYFFDEPNVETVKRISDFVVSEGLKMVVLFKSNLEFIKSNAICVDAGPWDFLSLIDNSEYVFTNSFHGCAFSVLFEKKFIAFGRNHSDSVKQTSRITTLLETVKSPKSFYDEKNSEFDFPETSVFDGCILKPRGQSLDYLKNCLKRSMIS